MEIWGPYKGHHTRLLFLTSPSCYLQKFWVLEFLKHLGVLPCVLGFPGGSDGREPAGNAGDLNLILRSGRSPGEGNGNLFQYSCLENSMDRGASWDPVHGVTRVGHDLATKPPPYLKVKSGENVAFLRAIFSVCSLKSILTVRLLIWSLKIWKSQIL